MRIKAQLRAPFVTADGEIQAVELELVELEGIGHGEDLDQAHWDLEGRRTEQPVWRLLGAQAGPPVEVNATIASPDPVGEARAAAQAGFRCVKVKVGRGDEAERIARVREAVGEDMQIRIDANGAWTVEQAIATLRELEPFGIELCEEPVHGLAAVEEVARESSVPIAIDETCSAQEAFDRRVCDSACLKLARCGGITGLMAAARRARAAGYRVYLASMLEGPFGIAAALHAATVIEPDRPSGLATLALFAGRDDPLPPREGRISLPAGPGFGDGLVSWYRQR